MSLRVLYIIEAALLFIPAFFFFAGSFTPVPNIPSPSDFSPLSEWGGGVEVPLSHGKS